MSSRTTKYYLRYPNCPGCGEIVKPTIGTCPHCITPLLVDRYRLIRIIAQTPTGSLFEAIDPRGRFYHIKRMIPIAGEDGSTRINEDLDGLELLEKLPCVPRYSKTFQQLQECYVVFPATKSIYLADALGKPWDPAQVMSFLDVALEAVDRMHRRGVILRNLTPSNLLYTCGERLMLIDYGKFLPRRNDAFAAPEIWQQQQPSDSTDLYHLGVTAYALLTGGKLPPPQRKRPAEELAIPPRLRAVLNNLLEPDPAQRPRDAYAARKHLQDASWRKIMTAVMFAALLGVVLALAQGGIVSFALIGK
jgi:serine/threonine protein kinase